MDPDDIDAEIEAAFTTDIDEDTGEVTITVEIGGEVFTGTGESIEAAAFTLGLGVGITRPDVVKMIGVEIEDADDLPWIGDEIEGEN